MSYGKTKEVPLLGVGGGQLPSTNDKIISAFFSVNPNSTAVQKGRKKLITIETMKGQYYQKWLHQTDKTDNTVEYDSTGNITDPYISNTSFTQVISAQAFNTLKRDKASLKDLSGKGQKKMDWEEALDGRKFTFVEASQFEEYLSFEKSLRHEKELVGEQYEWLLDDFRVDLRLPTPATRKALQDSCQTQMTVLEDNVLSLDVSWRKFSKQNHYDRSHIYIKDSYLSNAPAEQRSMKLKLVKEAVKMWRQRSDRDTMAYEDDHAYLMRKYNDVRIRTLDYDRYFVLATRYGPFNDADFAKDSRPGRRYWIKVTSGALKFQYLWMKFWAITKLKRHRGARFVQKIFRGWIKYKALHPIIKLRLKFGKRTYYIYAWAMWKQYNRICKSIKQSIIFYRQNKVGDCYKAWKGYVASKNERKNLVLKKFVTRMKNMGVARCYMAWHGYSKRCKLIKNKVRRMLQCPEFEIWLNYANKRKAHRLRSNYVITIQNIVRTFLLRSRFLRMKKSHQKIRIWWKITHVVNMTRREAMIRDYALWKPIELERRIEERREGEKRRQIRLSQFCADKEKKAIDEMKKFMKTKPGLVQRKEIAYQIRNENMLKMISKGKSMKMAEKVLIERSIALSADREKHDFNAKSPGFMPCPVYDCNHVAISQAQFEEHIHTAHVNDTTASFCEFMIMVRHSKGQEFLNSVLTKIYGYSSYSNCLDFWISLQEWKKVPTHTDMFIKKALNMYEFFLHPTGTRFLGFDYNNMELILFKLTNVKNLDLTASGNYRIGRAKKSLWRKLFNLNGKPYKMWTEDNTIPLKIFDELEWTCLLKVAKAYDVATNNSRMSVEFKRWSDLLTLDAERMEALFFLDFKKHRLEMFLEWGKDYKHKEFLKAQMAGTAADQLLNYGINNYVMFNCLTEGFNEKVFRIMHEEQSLHEANMASVEEALFWSEDNVLDKLWDFFVRAQLAHMWDREDCQKGMLEYIGKYQGGIKKKLVVDVTKRVDESWVPEFFKQTLADERKKLPKTFIQAAHIIQRWTRGVVGRNKARKVFAIVWAKKFDPTSNSCFYVNLKNSSTSWDPPVLRYKLWPRSAW